MSSIANTSVIIQSSSHAVPCPPPWFGEVVLISAHLCKQGILAKICERLRFARLRFGREEVIDFLAILFGYAISGDRTLQAFYEALIPVACPFMALFGRDQLPSRSALSRWLAALTPPVVEALRALFLEDGLSRPLCADAQEAGLLDRQGKLWTVFDVDGTREAARQRALPQTDDLPAPWRRLDEVCAPGYTGRKRGEVVRTRTVVSQAHSYQWLGSFGNKGNGHYRDELRRAKGTMDAYLAAQPLPHERALLRLEGQYGTGAVIADLAGFSFVTRGKAYSVLDRPEIQTRLHLPADQSFSRPESVLVRQLYDCPDVAVGPALVRCRVVVATPPKGATRRRIGLTRKGVVYELFLTNLPCDAFTPAEVLALYLHRGAFEPTLADEDQELDSDRWCSHSACGQEAWQIVSQWVWNLRLELGHVLKPEPLRTTKFPPALSEAKGGQEPEPGYQPPVVGGAWKAGCSSGKDFALQPDGTVCCPAGKRLSPQERRREGDGSLRLVYEARLADCRACPQRPQCQWHGNQAQHPRRVSVLLLPRAGGSAPLLWRDWPRREQRRACIQVLHRQQVNVMVPTAASARPPELPTVLSRAQRAHCRLSWVQRLARNARVPPAAPPPLTLYGLPDHCAAFRGLKGA